MIILKQNPSITTILNEKSPNILLSAWSKKLRNNKVNPKNYPHWKEVVIELKQGGYNITQLLHAQSNEQKIIECNNFIEYKTLMEAEKAIQECDVWVSVDNWVQHYGHLIGKRGVVVFSRSNPEIFGYVENTNILKGKEYLRPKQFERWDLDEFVMDSFPDPMTVVNAIKTQFLIPN